MNFYRKLFISIVAVTLCFTSLSAEKKSHQKKVVSDENLLEMSLDDVADENQFKIFKVTFTSSGKTKEQFLVNNISHINYSIVFKNKAELKDYAEAINQELVNQRLFENIKYTEKVVKIEDGIYFVEIDYTFDDSQSILALPKFGYDSNSGANLKVKLKDTNFLGMMNEMGIDINIQLGTTDYPQDFSLVTTGINFNYDLPFKIGNTTDTWSNDLSFSWLIGDTNPEYSYVTGLTFSFPFGEHAVNFSATQSIIRENDYRDWDDAIYFVENLCLSVPLTIGHIGNLTQIKYTPSLTFTWNWDYNGINSDNYNLTDTPLLKAGEVFSTSKIDWEEKYNFRKGFYYSAGQYVGWNFSETEFNEAITPYLDFTGEFFTNYKWIGFNSRLYVFAGYNTTVNVGSYLRGSADNQEFTTNTKGFSNNKALTSPQVIVLNLEFPIHIITTSWEQWGINIFGEYDNRPKFGKVVSYIPHKLAPYLDFELQINPFIDIGILTNRQTDEILSLKQGIYDAGFEVLVFPKKWSSYVVRLSAGFDVGKYISEHYGVLDSSWRNQSKYYEISFGLGKHF